MTRSNYVYRDERGMTLVFVAFGLLGLVSASMLAIDVGMLMTARAQAQNAADAGALAGATAMAYDDFGDRSASGPAVRNAIALATTRGNHVMGEAVSITSQDVAFVNDPNGQPNRIRVQVSREQERGNPLSTFIASFFGKPTADVRAAATAETVAANAASCLMPFALPDKWVDNNGPSNCFEAYFDGGVRRPRADLYIPPSPTQSSTGYSARSDAGTELRLRRHPDGSTAQAFHYLPIRLPGSNGAADCRTNVTTCNNAVLQAGDELAVEPGDLEQDIADGMAARVAQDPTAYWDTLNKRVVSRMNPSPRIVRVPLFDPDHYDRGRNVGRNYDMRMSNVLGLFIERVNGDDVFGRITPVGGLVRGTPPIDSFARTIRLVQ